MTSPDEGLLAIIHDRRSGTRLELVVPTYNEEDRIVRLIDFYRDEADVVLFDVSTDLTPDLAIDHRASVFRRIGDTSIQVERHFAYYINHLSKSGRAFFLHADEFISIDNLHLAARALEGGRAVWGERIDYMYGREMRSLRSSTPRGFCRGAAKYDPNRFHATLKIAVRGPADPAGITVPILHLHVWSVTGVFGKCGEYTMQEVVGILNGRRWLFGLVKRFIGRPLVYLIFRAWKEEPRRGLFWLTLDCANLPVALLCLMERRWFESSDAQRREYAAFYQTRGRSVDSAEGPPR